MSILISSFIIIVLATVGYFLFVIKQNKKSLKAVEENNKSPNQLLEHVQRLFDNEKSIWKEVLSKEGITIFTTFTQQEYVGNPGVKTYRVVSYLNESEITVDRMIELLDGGFLDEEVWYKKDFLGGQRLDTIERSEQLSVWIPQYISKIEPFRNRDFIYMLVRRDFLQNEYSKLHHPPQKTPIRQVGIAYKSVPYKATDSKLVRAIQYPSLDRISLYEDGTIQWEHIMAFHISGIFPQWLVNNLTKSAAEVLFNEAINMRNHLTPTSNLNN